MKKKGNNLPKMNIMEVAKSLMLPESVKLELNVAGTVLINSFVYTIGFQSIGKPSSKGFALSVAGEGVKNGLELEWAELHYFKNGKEKTLKKRFETSKNKSNEKVFMLRMSEIALPSGNANSTFGEQNKQKVFMEQTLTQFTIKFSGTYTNKQDSELLVTVYPYENIIEGASSKWIECTCDESYFERKFKG